MNPTTNPLLFAPETDQVAENIANMSAATVSTAAQDHPPAPEAHLDGLADFEDDPQLWDLAAPLAATAYGAYALHVTMGELHVLAAKILEFARRLSQLRTYARVADFDMTKAGGHAYHGLLKLYESITFFNLEDEYKQNYQQVLEEVAGVEPLLQACSVEDQLIRDLYASTHGAEMLHTAYNELEMRRQVALSDHYEIADYAKDLEFDRTYKSHARFAADDLGSTVTLLDTTQASVLVRATRAHHTLLQAVDYLTLQCNIFSREMSVSMDSVPVALRCGHRIYGNTTSLENQQSGLTVPAQTDLVI